MKRLLTWVLLSLALAACGDDDPTGPEETNFAGRYGLLTVNGDTLPLVITGDSATVTWVSGFFNLNADETFTYGFAFTVVQNGATSTENTGGLGFWARNNNAVLFEYGDGSFPDAATIVGRDMYLSSAGIAFVFRRE